MTALADDLLNLLREHPLVKSVRVVNTRIFRLRHIIFTTKLET